MSTINNSLQYSRVRADADVGVAWLVTLRLNSELRSRLQVFQRHITSQRIRKMMEFNFDLNWDIGKSAEELNASLFGVGKKKRNRATFAPDKHNEISAIVHDSDDEQFTKKGKKKLKKKLKKSKGEDGNSSKEISSTSTCNSPAAVNKKAKKRKLSSGDDGIPVQERDAGKQNSTESGSTGSVIDDKSKIKGLKVVETPASGDIEGKKKRRKTDVAAKSNTPEDPQIVPDGDQSKTKKRKNRKKKNNPSKNKYRHLCSPAASMGDRKDENGVDFLQSKDFVSQSKATTKLPADVKSSAGVSENSQLAGKKSKSKSHSVDLTALSSVQSPSLSEDFSKDSDKIVKSKASKRKNKEIKPSSLNELVKTDSVHDRKKSKKKKQKSEEVTAVSPVSKQPHKAFVEDRKQCATNIDNNKIQRIEEKQEKEYANSPNLKLDKGILKKMLSDSDMGVKNNRHKNQNGNTAPKKNVKSVSESPDGNEEKTQTVANKSSPFASLWGKGSGLTKQAKETLNSARFRFLNEQLYTCTGQEAMAIFQRDKEAFEVYHEGFEGQVAKWQVNPLDVFIKQIKDKPSSLVIADFGCGEARLAQSVPQKVHSFDLVALNERVTACDMAKVPLSSESVDISVFCLSLMGTNLSDYITEANRVLKTGGLLKVAEVVSRFKGLSPFISAVCAHGFALVNKRDLTKMFYLMDFKKIKSVKKSSVSAKVALKPCIYKRR